MAEVGSPSDTLEDALWEALKARGVGLLSLTKSGLHPLPVVVFVERRRRGLWLAAAGDSELVRSIGDGGAAIFTAQGAGMLASVSGNLTIDDDPRRLARLWTSVAQAWRPDGPRDPGLRLLRLDCVDAEVSLPEAGLMRFSWDLAPAAFRRRTGRRVSPPQLTLH
jgi:general stress protein 26